MTIQPTEWPMCVPPVETSVLWSVVEPMIESAYAAVDENVPDDLLPGLMSGRLLLWVSVRNGEIVAVLVTALLRRPSGLCCKLMTAAGVGDKQWAAWHERIEAYAKDECCAKLVAEGRPGWARVLPGYQTKRVVLEKRLT